MNPTMNNTTDNIAKEGIVSFGVAGDRAPALGPNQGDAQAFTILFMRYEPKLMATALVFTRFREEAKGIVQETFRKAFLELRQFEGKPSFLAWLTSIAVEEGLMLLSKRRAA